MRFIKYDYSVQNSGKNEFILNPQIVQISNMFEKNFLKYFFHPNPNNLVNGHGIITSYHIYDVIYWEKGMKYIKQENFKYKLYQNIEFGLLKIK